MHKNSCMAYHTVVSEDVGMDRGRDNSIRRERKHCKHTSFAGVKPMQHVM